MNLTVICVGSLKERYWKEAVGEYLKRLSAYCKPEIVEVKDEKTPEGATDREVKKILDTEGKRILEKIRDRAFVAALAIDGTAMDSEAFSLAHEKWEQAGRGELVFVIGGSLGLSGEVLKRADVRVSFSKLTFPHQLMRVILLEQIYRSYRIRTGAPYHK